MSPGIIYVVDVPMKTIRYDPQLLRSIFVPNEVVSTQQIPITAIKKTFALEEHKEYFEIKYPYPCEPLEQILVDAFGKRLFNTVRSRILRMLK